jgi:hypothetical protein
MGGVAGSIGGLFGGQKPATTIIQAAPVPTRSSTDVALAAELERKRKRAMLGRAGTNKTGDTGLEDEAVVARPSLLGGASQATGA